MTASLPLGLQLYRLLTTGLSPLVPWFLSSRLKAGKEEAARLHERLGHSHTPRPEGVLIWLHGASVGESLSHLPLLTALKAELPEAQFLVTSGTTTSAELLRARLPDYAMHHYVPVDTPGAAKAFIAHWAPNLAIFVESEIWPNLLLTARQSQIPTALVSARLSKSSQRNWAQNPKVAKTLLGGFDLILPQDAKAEAFFTALGLDCPARLNLKFTGEALPLPPHCPPVERAPPNAPLILAASTHMGEDEPILAGFAKIAAEIPRARLILVPRHPNRRDQICQVLQDHGHAPFVRSLGQDLSEVPEGGVYLADTLGELGLWFRLANTALICGSLRGGIGGHNPLEPARLNCPAFSGPYVDNWTYAYQRFEGKIPFVEANAHALFQALVFDLQNPQSAQQRAELAAMIASEGQMDLSSAATRLSALIRNRRSRLS